MVGDGPATAGADMGITIRSYTNQPHPWPQLRPGEVRQISVFLSCARPYVPSVSFVGSFRPGSGTSVPHEPLRLLRPRLSWRLEIGPGEQAVNQNHNVSLNLLHVAKIPCG